MAVGRLEVRVYEAGVHHVRGDVVGAFAVNWVAIYNQLEVCPFLVELYSSEPIYHSLVG